MYRLGAALFTPYHPVLVGTKWKFPKDLGKPETLKTDYVYNFVLDDGRDKRKHIINVGGIKACTLGHGIHSDKVIHHDYFGNYDLLTNDLQKFSKNDLGQIILDNDNFIRKNENGELNVIAIR